MGRKVQETNFRQRLGFFLAANFPDLLKKTGAHVLPNYLNDFFVSTVIYGMKYREQNNIRSNDILQSLIDLKNESQIDMNDIIGQVS